MSSLKQAFKSAMQRPLRTAFLMGAFAAVTVGVPLLTVEIASTADSSPDYSFFKPGQKSDNDAGRVTHALGNTNETQDELIGQYVIGGMVSLVLLTAGVGAVVHASRKKSTMNL